MPQETVALSDIAVFALRQPKDQRESVVIEVQTDADVSGWGEAPALPDLMSSVRLIERCKPHLVGLDATAAESIGRILIQRICSRKSVWC
jgi:L-alanine-DL-glutamate epimerase-like enolase superfamily enzyme